MKTRHFFMFFAMLTIHHSPNAMPKDYDPVDRFIPPSPTNYLMNYKICFGDDCTYGAESFIRDHRGNLKSEKGQEEMLDFIWHAVADIKSGSEMTAQENTPKRNDDMIIRRHMPDIAQRERLREKTAPQETPETYPDLSVSISFPYNKSTLPQIMEAVECLKIQLNEHKNSRSISRLHPRHSAI